VYDLAVLRERAAISIAARDVPEDFPDRNRLYPDAEEWLNDGDSVIVDPMGRMWPGRCGVNTGLWSPTSMRGLPAGRTTLSTLLATTTGLTSSAFA
jgi:hypothetical protein